jgi:hypothetical protein
MPTGNVVGEFNASSSVSIFPALNYDSIHKKSSMPNRSGFQGLVLKEAAKKNKGEIVIAYFK